MRTWTAWSPCSCAGWRRSRSRATTGARWSSGLIDPTGAAEPRGGPAARATSAMMAPMSGSRRHVIAASARVVALPAPALVLGAIVSVQFGAAVAAGLIRELGPLLTVTIRLDVAAVILVAFARPSLRGRTRRDWVAMALLGLSLAAMNLAFYQAIARLPLGVVTTIEFLGPLGLAAAASRRPRDIPGGMSTSSGRVPDASEAGSPAAR